MRQHGVPRRTIGAMPDPNTPAAPDSKEADRARSSPRAVAAAAILLVVVLGAVIVFLAVVFSRACA
jgi:hypothetical protein